MNFSDLCYFFKTEYTNFKFIKQILIVKIAKILFEVGKIFQPKFNFKNLVESCLNFLTIQFNPNEFPNCQSFTLKMRSNHYFIK